MESPNEYYLYAGEIFASKKPTVVCTVLGSCVAICLWDSDLKIGGINHFQLPLWNGEGLASPKYGNIAIQNLIEKMIQLGSDKRNLSAKMFGGASVFQHANNMFNVGEHNITLAEDMLREESISIVASHIGGKYGRKLKFNTGSGIVLLKKITQKLSA